MRFLALCVAALTIEFPGADSRAAEPAQQPPYAFTINGLPFTPRVFSLRDDPEHPAPGDLIAMGTMLLTLGPERDCRFLIASENENRWNFDRVFLRLSDGRKRLVGARVIHSSELDPKSAVINPLPRLSADEIHGLWGIYLDAWSKDMAQELQQIDPGRACITITGHALIQREGKQTFPPLPEGIQYLNTEGVRGNVENGEPLLQWRQLCFLRLDGCHRNVFDARWLAGNWKLRRLDLTGYMIEHPEALSELDQLESLDLQGVENLATVTFAEDLTRLRSLNLSDTAVSDVQLPENKSLAKLDVSRTKVSDLLYFGAENLEELDVSNTMVESLAPLWKLKRLREITASYSTVNKLPRRPLPALQNLTVISTPLSQASIDAFAKRNPKCVVSRRPEQWRRRLAGATRLRIRTGGANYSQYYELMPYLFPGKTLFEITDPARIRELVRLFEVDEKAPWVFDWHNSDPSFEFYRGEKLMAAMNWEYEMTELTPQSIHRVARWLAEHGYDELYKCEKTEAAREKRDLEQHAAIVRCYPERVRKVFDDLVKAADDGGEDDRDTDDAQDFSDKAAQVAKAVGDPVKLAVMTFRAMGAIVDSNSLARGHDDRILIVDAGSTVGDENFFKALEAIRGDRQAERGAARLYFEEEGYQNKTGLKHREWMIRLAPLLLNHDEDGAIGDVLFGDDGSGEQRTDATLRAIESLGGRAGLDILVDVGLDQGNRSVARQKSLLLLQKITGQHWYDPAKRQELDPIIEEARKWWREHGAEFLAHRRRVRPG